MPRSFSTTGTTIVDTAADIPTASAAYEGVMVFQKDTDRALVCNGSAWVIVGGRMPACILHKTTTQSISQNTVTAVQFGVSDTEILDTDGFHDPSTNNSRITVPAGLGGLYQINFHAAWPYSTGNGLIEGWAMHTRGATETRLGYEYDSSSSSTNEASGFSGSALYPLQAGDIVQLYIFQSKAASLTFGNGATIPPALSVAYIGAV
jgi:hypothetical protein